MARTSDIPDADADAAPEATPDRPRRRLTLLVQAAADDGFPNEPIEEDEFIHYCQDGEGARRLFNHVYDCQTWYTNEIAQLHQAEEDATKEVNTLRDRIKRKDAALAELAEERDRFRDAFAQEALIARTAGVARDSPGPEQSKKSSKIPDPPILTDGKEPRFEDWLLRIEDKLTANADHYPTPAMRLAYVKSRCGGKASEHLVARSRSDAVNKYGDATDVLEHLKSIYQDVNRVLTAKGKFRRLYMKPTDKFQEFLSEFSYLAQESGLAETEWKEELYYRIHEDMQRLVIRESIDDTLDFKDFATECTRFSNRAEQIAQKAQRGKNRIPVNNAARTPNQDANTPGQKAATPKPDQKAQPIGRLTPNERNQLMKEGKCFYCKEQGHLSTDCPAKKRALELRALEADNATNEHVNEDPGKVDP